MLDSGDRLDRDENVLEIQSQVDETTNDVSRGEPEVLLNDYFIRLGLSSEKGLSQTRGAQENGRSSDRRHSGNNDYLKRLPNPQDFRRQHALACFV